MMPVSSIAARPCLPGTEARAADLPADAYHSITAARRGRRLASDAYHGIDAPALDGCPQGLMLLQASLLEGRFDQRPEATTR
ncbi:MAG: hypothetical protein ABIV26_01510 [Candidatus Limnocylindrales bacterium]